jgi:hypothetical protein
MTTDEPDADESDADERSTHHRRQSVTEWADVPPDPDPGALDYDLDQWERIPTADDRQIIFLPGDEEAVEEEAFVVLEESDLCDLLHNR